MANVVVTGAGPIGLSTAMLLAKDGHTVTVLERDPAPVATPDEAWDSWERRGVNQFRLPHALLARFRQEAETELPEVLDELAAAGGLVENFIDTIPDEFKGGSLPGDERFAQVTARRPVVESVVARVANATPGVTVRRGVSVEGLLTGTPAAPGVPQVTGVRTDGDEELTCDLVVDAAGRRSPAAAWLEAAGARRPVDELEDSGFMYYGRHFRSPTGEHPVYIGPPLQHYESLSALTIASDNGTWAVVLVTSAKDADVRPLRDNERYTAVVQLLPLAAHWLDGEPLEDVRTIAKIEDRRRRYVVDGRPVATGIVPVGDAFACTNPSLGRGISIGMVHAVALRDHLRVGPLDDPVAFATGWAEVTAATAEPWYDSTLRFDRHRLAQCEAQAAGVPYEPEDPFWEQFNRFNFASAQDHELQRATFDAGMVFRTPEQTLADPRLAAKVDELGAGWRDEPRLGPSRQELLAAIAG
ncbi:MAG TPA: FAD-dependent oxidoreductase [Acidimicrobiales bacterium]|nr:FAD-dependent oxidoreductase [Acidimicrobiales bacterium]